MTGTKMAKSLKNDASTVESILQQNNCSKVVKII